MKYRKKPVVIEAMQWDGSTPSFDAIREWVVGSVDSDYAKYETVHLSDDRDYLVVVTLEDGKDDAPKSVHTADKGDWIIRGVKGEFYACKPEIFAATYDPVPTTPPSEKPE